LFEIIHELRGTMMRNTTNASRRSFCYQLSLPLPNMYHTSPSFAKNRICRPGTASSSDPWVQIHTSPHLSCITVCILTMGCLQTSPLYLLRRWLGSFSQCKHWFRQGRGSA